MATVAVSKTAISQVRVLHHLNYTNSSVRSNGYSATPGTLRLFVRIKHGRLLSDCRIVAIPLALGASICVKQTTLVRVQPVRLCFGKKIKKLPKLFLLVIFLRKLPTVKCANLGISHLEEKWSGDHNKILLLFMVS